MATSSDGVPGLPPMPDFSAFSRPFSSAGDAKFQLQDLLDSKQKQLEQAVTLGHRVLAQQMELEERVRQLQEIDMDKQEGDEIDSEARERYRELADTITSWDAENAQLSTAFGGSSKGFVNGKDPSPTIPYAELPREEPERYKASAGTSAAQSRRAKNAAHRADDVEFAFEIGSGLLTEVRRLQSLLGERDKAIQDMKEEKDDLEKSVESLRTALRQQEQSADKFKEENWNLEVTLQELRTQLSDSQGSTQRLEGEHKRLTKLLSASRDAGDQHKNESERLQNVIEEMKAKHETDVAQARKHAAGLARDKSDLQQTVDNMKAEAARAGRRPRFGSPLTPNGPGSSDFLTPGDKDEDDVFSTTGGASTNRRKLDTSAMFPAEGFGSDFADSPEPSPVRPPFLASNHPSNEIEALQQRLAHAQRQINTLKGTLQREKELRMDYRRKLDASPGGFVGVEAEEDEVGYEDEDTVGTKPPKARLTPYKSTAGRGRARGGRARAGLSLAERLNLAANSPSSDYNDEPSDFDPATPPPPVPSIPIQFQEHAFDAASLEPEDLQEDEEEKENGHRSTRSPSPYDIPSNRTSVDGMDPAFANVLRRKPSIPHTGSPLRHSAVPRPGRGGTVGRRSRGGMAFQEARPPSLVAETGDLATELNIGGSPMRSIEITEEGFKDIVETAEFGCQTDFVEEPPLPPSPPPPPILVSPATTDMGIQAEPEPEPEVEPVPVPVPPPAVVTVDMSMQTEDEPVVARSEIAVQHAYVEPGPVLVSMSVNTDPEIVPPAPVLVQTEVQTLSSERADVDTQTPPPLEIPPVVKMDMDTQTTPASPRSTVGLDLGHADEFGVARRTTITQHDISISSSSSSSGNTTITRAPIRTFLAEQDGDEEDDGDETETGADTETDTDDYHDAPQSILMSTPSQSQDDFHSVLTVSDNDFSESDDESIRASRLPSRAGASGASSVVEGRPSSFYAAVPVPVVTYESKSVSAEVVEEPKPEPQPEPEPEPKPELKEMSIQTDEWTPPAPPAPPSPPTPTPAATPGLNLYRVGSSSHQFQFIAPPSVSASAGSTPASTTIPIPMPVPIPTPPSNVFRESPAAFGVYPRSSTPDRRQSIDSAIESAMDDTPSRSRVHSGGTTLTVVDKTRPPMMALPPPPRLPPPPASMPPPSFIPERRIPTSSTGSYELPPPRPSSPPPPELIQRATTPTFGSVLSVPGGKAGFGLRQHGSSMPPSQQGLRQPPSTSSFRSAANAAAYAQHSMPPSGILSSFSVRERERRELSAVSLVSDRSMASPRSSMSSDHNPYANRSQALPDPPVTPNKTADLSTRTPNNGANSTDPAIIHAITQTMIGEFLYKYTRRTIGKGYGQTRHKRFFWVHPYTKTLYWSSADPGSSNVSESSAKSAYIEGVRSVLDPNPMPPGLYQYSVVVSTPQREMKITAPTKERHDIWLNALKYLLSRPSGMNIASPANATAVPQSPMSVGEFTDEERRPPITSSPQSQRSSRSVGQNGDTWNTTPRGQRSRSQLSVGGSIGKRSGTPAVEYLRWNGPESPYSPTKSFEHIAGHDEEDLDFELHADSHSDDGFEGLENVRACCDGRHTVGHSGKHHHHHHHNHPIDHPPNSDQNHLDVAPQEPPRPVSPSAWSFRSRTGSAHSHEGGGNGIFSWGRGEDGKLRFGSRRSAKTVPTHDQ